MTLQLWGISAVGQEVEYRGLVEDVVGCCRRNHLQQNTSKSKLVVDFWRSRPPWSSVSIGGVEVVQTSKYLGVHLDTKLEKTLNTDALSRKDQTRLYILRRLSSFNVYSKMLQMF